MFSPLISDCRDSRACRTLGFFKAGRAKPCPVRSGLGRCGQSGCCGFIKLLPSVEPTLFRIFFIFLQSRLVYAKLVEILWNCSVDVMVDFPPTMSSFPYKNVSSSSHSSAFRAAGCSRLSPWSHEKSPPTLSCGRSMLSLSLSNDAKLPKLLAFCFPGDLNSCFASVACN